MTRLRIAATLAAALLAATGCQKRNQLAQMPPPTVTVDRPVTENVVDYAEFTGVTRAAARVDLRARVKGMLLEIKFTDGQIVKKGDLLFVIDPKPYANAERAARAALEKARASLGLAEQQLTRTQELRSRNATSQEALDAQVAQRAVAAAEVSSAEASLKTAELNLGYTQVKAPLSGRISENLVDVGNLVQAETTILAHIDAIDPIQAYFTVSERDVARLNEVNARAAGQPPTPGSHEPLPPQNSPKTSPDEDPSKKAGEEIDPEPPTANRAAGLAAASENDAETDQISDQPSGPRASGPHADGVRVNQTEVLMALGDTGRFEFRGTLDYEEFGVEEGTGTVMRRAVFPNADGRLIPGMFVRIRMALGPPAPKLLVEDRAIVADQRGEYVLVVGDKDMVENRPVKLGSLHGTKRVIEEGVKPDDRVVVIGVQRARPGMPVTPRFPGEPDPNAKPPAGTATAQRPHGSGDGAASSKGASPAGTGSTSSSPAASVGGPNTQSTAESSIPEQPAARQAGAPGGQTPPAGASGGNSGGPNG